jgi:hypothetical protein
MKKWQAYILLGGPGGQIELPAKEMLDGATLGVALFQLSQRMGSFTGLTQLGGEIVGVRVIQVFSPEPPTMFNPACPEQNPIITGQDPAFEQIVAEHEAAMAGNERFLQENRPFADEMAEPARELRSLQGLNQELTNGDSIILRWTIGDVIAVRPDLSEDDARDVLEAVEHDHDASVGVNWDVITATADRLFDKP